MKKLFFSLIIFAGLAVTVNAQHANFPSIVVDYGTIERNSNGEREFPFTNDGDKPLVITNAQGSCGCTIPTWPKDPIEPGQSNVIKAKYDTNRLGQFTKTITLTTNSADPAQQTIQLTIKGNVTESPKPDLSIPGVVAPTELPTPPAVPAAPAVVPAPGQNDVKVPGQPN